MVKTADGPVVCEPFSQELRTMPAEQALSTGRRDEEAVALIDP